MKLSVIFWGRSLEILPLEPLHFFNIGFAILKYKGKVESHLSKSHRLPNLTSVFDESSFAEAFLGWNEEGIFFDANVDVNKKIQIYFPDFRKGDSLELFIDTRAMKNASYTHKFCHHFVFLPLPFGEEGEKIQAKEVTKFRGEETHDLADPSLFLVSTEETRKGYHLHIFIPKEALHGYDPLNFTRLGFTYRINRPYRPAQYFSASGDESQIEYHPTLWATGNLT